jgi:hypothetical protein
MTGIAVMVAWSVGLGLVAMEAYRRSGAKA